MTGLLKLDAKNIENILALSPMQEGMLYHYLSSSSTRQYFEQLSLRLSGDINISLIRKAWYFVIETNEMLRTIFRWDSLDKPVQIILKKYSLPIEEYDLRGMTQDKREEKLEEIKEADRSRGLDISKESLRIILVKLEKDKLEMITGNHHILYDGWSNGIILKEFLHAYNKYSNNEEPEKIIKNRFNEYIKWHQTLNKAAQEKYWKEYLENYEPKALDLISKKNHHNEKAVGRYTVRYPKEVCAQISSFCEKQRITVAVLIYTIWGILLQKYNNTDDVAFGTTVSGRGININGIEEIVGLFINTPPLRIKSSTNELCEDLLERVHFMLQERKEFENIPIVDIKKYSGIDMRDNIFDTIVVIDNYPLDKYMASKNGNINLEAYSSFEMTNYDLTLSVELLDGININYLYNGQVFTEKIIERIALHFDNITTSILDNPKAKLSEIEMLASGEKEQLLFKHNLISSSCQISTLTMEFFSEQVQRKTGNVALVYKGIQMSYEELDREADRLACSLREMGVGRNIIVAVMLERSIELVVVLYAVLKSGGAYLPIDPKYPRDRIEYMLNDSGASLLLAADRMNLGISFKGRIIDIYECKQVYGDSALEFINEKEDLAYIIYTSGSTGRPKGVMVDHGSLINLLLTMQKLYPLTEQDAYLFKTTFTFDVSISEIFGWFFEGGRLVILEKDAEKDLGIIAETIYKNKITHVGFVPTALAAFLEYLELNNYYGIKSIKYIVSCGEILTREHVSSFENVFGRGAASTRLENVYGPTETTIFATAYSLSSYQWDTPNIPIGKPIAGISAYILDRNRALLPVGAVGELYLGGRALARGYINKPELTSEKFITNPYKSGERLYKTGDLARWSLGVDGLPDGNIEFLGRLDHQIKLRGFRVELGEIESALLKHSDIQEAVVTVINNKADKSLCAYYVSSRHIDEAEIRMLLARELPEYMIPSYYIRLDCIPLLSNGKIDRSKLTGIEVTKSLDREYTAPSNEIEKALADIWQSILEVQHIGVYERFFELGGHSIKAMKLAAKIQKKFKKSISIKEILNNVNIKELADIIIKCDMEYIASLEAAENKEYYPVSYSQRGLFLLSQHSDIGTAYNMTEVLELEDKPDRLKLIEIFNELVDRHEALRTSFAYVEGELVQKIHDSLVLKIEYVEGAAESLDDVIHKLVSPFDLSIAPLIRIGIIDTSKDKLYLVIDMHHIISDGMSVNILIKEFNSLYRGEKLPPLKFQYKDYVLWQQSFYCSEKLIKQRDYWLNIYRDKPPATNIPIDYPRGNILSFEGGMTEFEINSDLCSQLKELAYKNGVSLFTILYSVFNLLLWKYCDQTDIVVGVPTSGRNSPDVENIIGMFVNTLAVRNVIRVKDTFIEFLYMVNENLKNALDNQDYQISELIRSLKLNRASNRHMLFDTVFVLQNMGLEQITMDDIKLRPYKLKKIYSKYDILMSAFDKGDIIAFSILYCSSIFKKDTIERFGGHYKTLLEQIVKNPFESLYKLEIERQETEKVIRQELDAEFDF